MGASSPRGVLPPSQPEVLQRALLELLEQPQENPLVFLARQFKSVACECSVEKRAAGLVLRCSQGYWAFKQNVADAYEALFKGGGGVVTQGSYQRLLDQLAADAPVATEAQLLLLPPKALEVPF